MSRLLLSCLFALLAAPALAQYYPTVPPAEDDSGGFKPDYMAPAPLRPDAIPPEPESDQLQVPPVAEPTAPTPIEPTPAPLEPTSDTDLDPIVIPPQPTLEPTFPPPPAPPTTGDSNPLGADLSIPVIEELRDTIDPATEAPTAPPQQSEDPFNPVIRRGSSLWIKPLRAAMTTAADPRPLIDRFTGSWLTDELTEPVMIGLTQVMFPVDDGCGEQPQPIATAATMNSRDVVAFLKKAGRGGRFSRAVDALGRELVQPAYPVLEFACAGEAVLFIQLEPNQMLAVQRLPTDGTLWVARLTRQ